MGDLTVFAEQIYLLRLKEILFQDTVQILLYKTDQNLSVMLRPLIKSFLRHPITFNSGGRKGKWRGFEGKTGGEGFSRRILFGAAVATGIAFFCTDTCPYTG